MTEDAGPNRQDNYRECCPWLMLTRSFTYAVSIQVLMLAALGALGTAAGWRISERVMLDAAEVDPASQLELDMAYLGAWPGSRHAPVCPFSSDAGRWFDRTGNPPADPVMSVPYRIVQPLVQALNRGLSWRQFGYYVLGGLWTLVVWSFIGGAITRIATVRFGRDERISIRSAIQHGRDKIGSHMAAFLVPLFAAVVIGLLSMLFGLVARVSIGATLTGALWFVPLMFAIVMAAILIGVMFGWPLMWGAIDTERSDSFDAMSRAYAYAYQRPIKYVMYALLAVAVGMLGWLFVWLLSEMVIQLTEVTVGVGAGANRSAQLLGEAETASPLVRAGENMVQFWHGVVRTLASAYGFGYFWCAIAGIYLLLRLDVDATELDDIPVDDPALQYGLPALDKDDLGLPTVAAESDE